MTKAAKFLELNVGGKKKVFELVSVEVSQEAVRRKKATFDARGQSTLAKKFINGMYGFYVMKK